MVNPERMAMIVLAIWLLVLLIFDLAAWKWGVDSRDGTPDTHSESMYRRY